MISDSYTHVNTNDGKYYHFDVIVADENIQKEIINSYAKKYLGIIGIFDANIEQSTCEFCHNEMVDERIENIIKEHGCYILPMEGCTKNE